MKIPGWLGAIVRRSSFLLLTALSCWGVLAGAAGAKPCSSRPDDRYDISVYYYPGWHTIVGRPLAVKSPWDPILGYADKAHWSESDFELVTINGTPGLLMRHALAGDGTFSFDIEDGRIRAIYVVRNPDKLRGFLEHAR